VTYAQLVHALEAEVGNATREMRAAAGREAEAMLAEARRQVAAERAAALSRTQAEIDAAAAQARARAELDEERETLLLERRLLSDVELAARERLAAIDDSAVLARLKSEILAEAGSGAIEWHGAEAIVDGRIVLDNTLGSRLKRAWPALEREVAETLFGGGDGAL
jgi:V/A-type H+/Na+-transporting ATPase subunit E